MWFWMFLISCFFHLIAIFYVRWLIKSLAVVNEDVGAVNDMIVTFSAHLKSLYEMEMFYGDESLKSLLDHASKLSERLENLDLLLDEGEEGVINDKEEKKTNQE